MVGDAQNLYPVGLKMVIESNRFVANFRLGWYAPHPFWSIQGARHLGFDRQFRKCRHVAVPGIENWHPETDAYTDRARVSKAHGLRRPPQKKVHVWHLAARFTSLFYVFAAIGDVVTLFDLNTNYSCFSAAASNACFSMALSPM